MRVIKDVLLKRTVAYNLPQLFDLLTSNLEFHYNARIISVALGQPTAVQRSRFLPDVKTCDIRQVIFIVFFVVCSFCNGTLHTLL